MARDISKADYNESRFYFMANGDNASVTLASIRSGSAFFQTDNTTNSSEILAVQKALYLYGFYPGDRDGYYGPSTVAAVRGLQNEMGLTVNGNMNKATLQKLESWSGTLYGTRTATPSLNTVRNGLDYYHKGDSGSAVTTIRSLLRAKGYTCSAEGSYDDSLFSIVKSFQSAYGLGADGLLGQATLAVLEDTSSDSSWLVSGTVQLTAGKLARAGFTNLMLRRDNVTKLNTALNTYGINTREKVRQFLAQCYVETDSGRAFTEYGYKPGVTGSANYAPYYGAGMIHLSTLANYTEYKSYKGDSEILSPSTYATQHVAFTYPADSAGWFWDKCGKINANVNWSDTSYNICAAVTRIVNGSTSTVATRYSRYSTIASVLI